MLLVFGWAEGSRFVGKIWKYLENPDKIRADQKKELEGQYGNECSSIETMWSLFWIKQIKREISKDLEEKRAELASITYPDRTHRNGRFTQTQLTDIFVDYLSDRLFQPGVI